MNCNECIHNELCNERERSNGKFPVRPCEFFKPTPDMVEVVYCKDCKYLYCFSAIDRQFYCRHYPKGLQGINIIEDNPYCSYGERRDV